MNITSDAQSNCSPPPVYTQPAPQAAEESPMNSLLQKSFRMSYDTEYPSGQFQLALLTLFPPSCLSPLMRMALAPYNAALQQL